MSIDPGHPIRTVLFDLDGTLLDTAPDLAFALNEVLKEQGRPPLAFQEIRRVVSHGGRALIQLGFDLPPDQAESEQLRLRLLDIYLKNLCRETRLFPGMEAVLQSIEDRGMNWGIVTNKPAFLTDPLLEQLGLDHRAACIVSGDTLEQRKPDAAPMLYACHQARSEARQCVYIGDAERDVQAGRNAGMHTLVAMFGYFTKEDDPLSWDADEYIQVPGDILDWLDKQSVPANQGGIIPP